MEETFGSFLSRKRREAGLTMKQVSEVIHISQPYLSDIEKGNRNPPDLTKLETLAKALQLTQEERSVFFNLAGESRESVAPDLTGYVSSHRYISEALRTARDLGADEKDWADFAELLERRREK